MEAGEQRLAMQAQAEAVEAYHEMLLNSFEKVIKTEEGRHVICHILKVCGVDDPVFAGENTHVMAFQEGKRNVGLSLKTLLTAFPKCDMDMQAEERIRQDRLGAGAKRKMH